jgi:hypothetical protein
MFGKEERSFLTAGRTQIKPLAGEGAEVVVAAVRVAAAYMGYALSVIAAGEKVFADCLYSFEAELPVCAGIIFLIAAAKIGKMPIEYPMEAISSPGDVPGLLLSLCGNILYTHIEYKCKNVCATSS